MKTTFRLFLACIATLFLFTANAQRAKDGNYTATATNEVVNTYTYATASAGAGSSFLTVNDNAMTGASFGGALVQGDLVMVVQMYGATTDINTYPTAAGWGPYTVPQSYFTTWDSLPQYFGRVTGYANAGKFEVREVLSISGSNVINLTCGLENSYSASKAVQIVRIPRFDNLTVNAAASIEPTQWDGQTGGIVALEVDNVLDVQGTISATGFGFRGGELDAVGTAGNGAVEVDYKFLGSNSSGEGSEKGEGILGWHTAYDALESRYGKGAIANGGGGGAYQNCGGGGGSNVDAGASVPANYNGRGNPVGFAAAWALDPTVSSSTGGGSGGYSISSDNENALVEGPNNFAWDEDNRKVNGGFGGHPLTYDATRMFFGGGGGAGDQDSDEGGAGGNGGGIVYIMNYGTVTGSGTIEANGAAGQNTNPNNLAATAGNPRRGIDAAGGGGAGGSVYIENAAALPAAINLNAIGGKGGDQNITLYWPGNPFPQPLQEASGPGGSGSGGLIRFSSGAPTESVVAGVNGVTNSGQLTEFPPNGATTGSGGITGTGAPYFDFVLQDSTICLGQSLDIVATLLGSIPGGSTVQWYTVPFGGSSVNSGLVYSAVSPAVTTTYYVGVCPGTFRVPVTITVTAGANLLTTDPAAICAPGTVDITLPAITAGSDVGTLTYFQDNGMVTTEPTPGAIGTAGWYYIHLDIGGGCDALDSVQVTINPADNAAFTSSDFCVSTTNTISGVALPGGTYSIQSQTGSGLATITAGTGVLANYVAGDQITIEYTTAGPCPSTSTQVVNVLPADDPAFTSSDFCVSAVNTISGVATPGGTYSIQSQTGSGLVTITSGTGILANYVAGDQITIQYTTTGACAATSTQVVNVTPSDDASFTSADFCASSVNTISGVALPGGTYSIQSQTGSGLATITSGTGVLANYVAGDQITIEYTTPAGACQNTSTQVVNVLPLDDASFTSTDFCASSVNTISGVALAGGVYSIQSQTGSGLATITSGTGVLANFVAGDQITIEYTTTGGCPNTSTQVVNVLPADDPAFSSFDFCVSSVNTISGVATPGGTYSIQSQTGSGLVTITPGTGILANYVAGDQITIEYTTTGTCPSTSTQAVNVTNLDDASFTSVDFCVASVNTISGVATPGGTYSIQSQTGSGLATITPGTGVLANYVAGDQITIEYTTAAGGCQNASTQVVNVTNLDDATFASSDFCVSSVNTIGGVVTPGGVYAIQSQTGSGLATITPGTGILANYVAGDQITIEYTTPAGGCQNTSTQVVNVTPLDDASFTTVDFCASDVNTISGVASPGGVYSIQSQTGSGLVTITPATGVLANYVLGDQITIEYTTTGACPNTSTQIVTVTPSDDASFVSSDFCVSGTNMLSSVATAGGTYSIQSQTGSGLATITSGTGVLANYVAGDQITIEYTTPAGPCQSTSTQVVNVLPLDDASFTSVDFCVSSVNAISSVATPGGTYSIQSQTGSGLATITTGTGVLANYVAGDQITIEYTTAGGCPNTSTQVVNVTPLDDPAFTSSDFCVSSVNTISGVATPGGVYAIQSQTGSGLVTITPGTGVLANYVAGDQITIEYTTTGACPNTSTQVVNVTLLDDPAFTSADFCVSSVNSISSVATPGGTYSIQSQTGSGLATITAATGVLANYVAGDQITIEYTTNGACSNTSTQVVNVTPLDDASFTSVDFCESAVNVISVVATPGGTYAISAQTGSATITTGTGVLAGFAAGDQITIEYTTTGACPNTSTQVVNVLPNDDATFTTFDFCESSVNVVSGVVTPGGAYTIQSQTGSGTVMIDGATGVLSNFVAGDQIIIEYTTNGTCPNTSTQTVTVTTQDDASFTSVDFCASGVNTISGVATPGGTYTISAQTGAATIDAATGVLSGFVGGDQITIEYTTPAGACQNAATQIVNVISSDDGSFTMTATCEGGTATVSGLAGGTFDFVTAPTDGAVIDAATGTISSGTNGTSYDVEYTTNGACPVTTTQNVIVLAADDASFTLTPTCDGAVAVVLGTSGGTFSFVTVPGDAAIIDPATGDVTGGDFNSTYDIEYLTAGACPASTTQQVIVDDCTVTNLVIPTAFTPGADGINSTWEIQDLDNNYPDNSVTIFNRWGNVVFEFTSSTANPYALNQWDGTYNGKELPVASYYYVIDANDGSGETFKGTVTIVKN